MTPHAWTADANGLLQCERCGVLRLPDGAYLDAGGVFAGLGATVARCPSRFGARVRVPPMPGRGTAWERFPGVNKGAPLQGGMG